LNKQDIESLLIRLDPTCTNLPSNIENNVIMKFEFNNGGNSAKRPSTRYDASHFNESMIMDASFNKEERKHPFDFDTRHPLVNMENRIQNESLR
jgi:hypothetical protein